MSPETQTISLRFASGNSLCFGGQCTCYFPHNRYLTVYYCVYCIEDQNLTQTILILIIHFYAFILYVSDSGRQCNKYNSYWNRVQYQDRQTALESWYGPVEMILTSPPARAISFPLVRITTLGQSVYPDIALHISNYYININF